MLRSLERNESSRYIIRYLTDFSEERNALNKNLFDSLYIDEYETNDEKMLINMLITLFRNESQTHNNYISNNKSYIVNKDCMKMLKIFLTYHYNYSDIKKVDNFLFKLR